VFEVTEIEKPQEKVTVESRNPAQRLTAFWAFSEAGFGGVLHITRLPFKGVFIAGAATLFISLIAQFSKIKGKILKSTLLVIVIKFIVSPHTPITAAVAVFAQGLFGELFFFSKKLKKILVPAFAMFIQFITAVQKIIIVTVLFGENFWITLDDFSNSILNKFITVEKIEFSILVAGAYIIIHVLAGLYLGIFILKLFKRLEENGTLANNELNAYEFESLSFDNAKKRKHWYQKPSGILILLFFLVLLSFSFFVPEWASGKLTEIIVMSVRAVMIVLLWFFLISPLLRKFISKLVLKQKVKHFVEIDRILHFFPQIREIVSHSWKNSKSYKGIARIEFFLLTLIQYSISS
jgi:hypothetical protein